MAPYLILLVIGLPWMGALFVWWAGDQRPRLQHTLAALFALTAGAAALWLLPYADSRAAIRFPAEPTFWSISFVADGLAIFLAAIAAVIGSLAIIFSIDYMHAASQLGRYYALVLFFIGAMCGLVLSSNLLLIFFFWEITAFCSYALISFHNDDPKAVHGGMKALIITQVGGIGLLLGALFIYSHTGSIDIQTFLAKPSQLPAGALAITAYGFLIAAAAKSAQFPFHTWLPDAMEAPSPVSALIHAATMVNAGVYLLARFFPAFAAVPGWASAVLLTGALSALLAALMALTATDLKRVLAYSTVSQLGYMVYAVGAGSILTAQFHLFSHAIFKALLFLAAGAVIHSLGTRDLRQMGGLGQQMPQIRAVFILGSLALAGLPFLNGFWSKELVLEAGLAGGPLWAFSIVLLAAGLTAVYSFRMVWLVFFGMRRSHLHGHDAAPAMKISLFVLAAGTLLSWLLVGPFSHLLEATLPFHAIQSERTTVILGEVLSAPSTALAMAVIFLGLAAWWWREQLAGLVNRLNGISRLSVNSFGFEAINTTIVKATERGAEALRSTHTGLINWNVLAIITALVMIMAILALGA
ncbi:MAG TPA: NADH-quinone oxidoreductase subunit L [Levilinea sp.]|nr:NADH-quinone oxidoreductase subunit L [Levilinea sp.]